MAFPRGSAFAQDPTRRVDLAPPYVAPRPPRQPVASTAVGLTEIPRQSLEDIYDRLNRLAASSSRMASGYARTDLTDEIEEVRDMVYAWLR